MERTICAISSPPGPGQRGILRLSGAEVRDLVNRALVRPRPALDAGASRGVVAGRLDDGRGTQPVTVLWMPGPRSYTREDVAELHLPGAPVLLARALERMLELGASAAQPGEFTRRAFLNGRIDLSRAEGVLSLIEATNEAERRAATGLLEGGLERRVRGLREGLWDLRALCEASLDFDEADTGHVPVAQLSELADGLLAQLDGALAWEVARQPPSALPRVLLFGAPNGGKSTLFNALVPEGSALVSDLAGTTRDSLIGLARLGDRSVCLVDAPGLDPAARGPDASAQRLAAGDRRRADLLLWLIAADDPGARAEALASQVAALPTRVPVLVVLSKSDRGAPGSRERVEALLDRMGERFALRVAISVHDSLGLGELERAVQGALTPASADPQGAAGAGGPVGSGGAAAGPGRELFARHRSALAAARGELHRARRDLATGMPLDQVAETLRGAGRGLDQISGETTVEDVLDRIFAQFCIGK